MPNDKREYIYTDSSDVEHRIHIYENSFNFAQKDKKIHDTKFLTKPTTFLRDAFKRFCKNKSSVAGAIILGILLLGSIIIPFADPYDIENQHPEEIFLEPKLFPTGTGWWDGTKRMTDVPIDPATLETREDGKVYGYPMENSYPRRSVLDISEARVGYVSNQTAAASGGFLNLINNHFIFTEDEEAALRNVVSLSSPNYEYNLNNTYNLEIVFLADEIPNYNPADYSVYVSYEYKLNSVEDDEETPSEEETPLPEEEVREGETEGETPLDPENPDEEGEETVEEGVTTYTYDLLSYDDHSSLEAGVFTDLLGNDNNILTFKANDIFSLINADESLDLTQGSISNIQINVGLKPLVNTNSSLGIQSIQVFDGALKLDDISWTDANANLLLKSSDDGYWSSNGIKNLYRGVSYVCDFTFDTYAVPYGEKEKTIGTSDIRNYVENGWLKPEILTDDVFNEWYNITLLNYGQDQVISEAIQPTFETYFTDLSETKLPILEILGVNRTNYDGIYTYSFDCMVSGYKELGYEEMPSFLFGTDNYGYDMLKRVFTGLLTSLGLGIMIFAICFTFGLIYGAICGYFGGNIDIALQRFCDLLSGIPWIVIMTLCILNLGSNFGTFMLAMCLTGWIGTASLTRTQFYRFRDREYTLASRTLGASNFRLIFKHILPNAMGTIITSAVLMIPSVIFTEATISYLGLGFQDMQSLGVILSDNQTYLNTYSYLILFPSAIMALIMISFNLFGNGLRDAFNPSLKGSD